MSELTTTHDGIEIRYDEANDVWRFEVRGRERSTPTLSEAKRLIEKPDKTEKKQFKRISCYLLDHGAKAKIVEVTSIAEAKGWDGKPYFWTMAGKDRSKESASSLFPVGGSNDEIMAKIERLSEEMKKLYQEKEALAKTLKPLVIKDE